MIKIEIKIEDKTKYLTTVRTEIKELNSTNTEKEVAEVIKKRLDVKDEDKVLKASEPNFENDLLKEIEKIIKKYYK